MLETAIILAPIIQIAVELLKPFNLNPDFYPHVSLLCGLGVGIVLSIIYQNPEFILSGLLGALSASGLYDLGKGSLK